MRQVHSHQSQAASQSETLLSENFEMRRVLSTFRWEKQQDAASQILILLTFKVSLKMWLKIKTNHCTKSSQYPDQVWDKFIFSSHFVSGCELKLQLKDQRALLVSHFSKKGDLRIFSYTSTDFKVLEIWTRSTYRNDWIIDINIPAQIHSERSLSSLKCFSFFLIWLNLFKIYI